MAQLGILFAPLFLHFCIFSLSHIVFSLLATGFMPDFYLFDFGFCSVWLFSWFPLAFLTIETFG